MPVHRIPPRTFGISLAIILSLLMITILPLIEMAFWLRINEIVYVGNASISGVDIQGISSTRMMFQFIVALIFAVIGIMAWRGRPPKIRLGITAAVLLVTTLTILIRIVPDLTAAPLDSSAVLAKQLAPTYLISTLLITLYVVWYMNRWPARAFYRGYYLPNELEVLQQVEEVAEPV